MSAPAADPRIAMGYEVHPSVRGPYSIMPAKQDGTGNDGGILDVGIMARTSDGTRIVIGEIWAACPDDGGGKTRIDAHRVATEIVTQLNKAEGSAD